MFKTLMFHRVLPKDKIDILDAYFLRGTLIDTELLESIIQEYFTRGYQFCTLQDALQQGKENKTVVFTFDDGYQDNFDYVMPILEKYKIRASFYPIIGYCDSQTLAPLDYYYHFVNTRVTMQDKDKWISGSVKQQFLNLNHQNKSQFIRQMFNGQLPKSADIPCSYMETVHLQELQNLGHEIGGHSMFHDIYTKIDYSYMVKDFEETMDLFKRFHLSMSTYAYTDGQYNEEIISFLRDQNLLAACAIRDNHLSPFRHFELEREFITHK